MRERVRYADHLQLRLSLRRIPKNLPRSVFRQAKEFFYDEITSNFIAVAEARYAGKNREMMVAFLEKDDGVILITVHPLKPHQKANRVASGRWIPHEREKKQTPR
jgi:hypothetical protein